MNGSSSSRRRSKPLRKATVTAEDQAGKGTSRSQRPRIGRSRLPQVSLDTWFRRQQRVLPVALVLLTLAVCGGVAAWQVATSTAGLYTTTSPEMTPAPAELRRTVCVDEAQTTVLRAFTERHWHVIPLKRKSSEARDHYLSCYHQSRAAIIWTKLIPRNWNSSQVWQRHNQLPFETSMSKKAQTAEFFRAYELTTGRSLPFIPESYVLPDDRLSLLRRLTLGSASSLRGAGVSGSDISGDNEPWVVKLSAIDNGVGIAMLGPGSDELKRLTDILRKADPADAAQYMTEIRQHLVFEQKGDTRKAAEIEKAKNRTEKAHDKIIVQRYICHELDYQKRKFDLRMYFLVASVDPLVVLYHDGFLRVSPNDYNEGKFESTGEHLTNLGRNAGGENNTISFETWEVELRNLVEAHPERYTWSVRRDPLGHIRKQIKSALADLVAATRQQAFRGYRTYTNMENGFALMGADFIVDRDLNVWFTEGQDSPGLLHETKMKRKLNDRLLPATVDIIGEVLDKQSTGKPLLPLYKIGDFALIYTDDYHFRYDYVRSPLLGPCQATEE